MKPANRGLAATTVHQMIKRIELVSGVLDAQLNADLATRLFFKARVGTRQYLKIAAECVMQK